jgi:23S rRNA (cytosine1962-C5)-methyltransferase
METTEQSGFHSDTPEKTAEQAVMFVNRLEKQYRHLRKWARRTGTTCYRLYDKDIPEIPLAVDLYQESGTEDKFLHIALYERPYDKPEEAERIWIDAMKAAASGMLAIPSERVFTKIRRHQRGEESQYVRLEHAGSRIVVEEGGSRFLVNLSDYLDTGIFLDHRPARLMIRNEAEGKRVLNLFCYTGTFSVHAASGGAKSVTSVDLSKTYLSWAAENLALNGFSTTAPGAGHALAIVQATEQNRWPCIHSDVKAFLSVAKRTGEKWDIIVCDPPTFSNSKRSVETLDINRDWAELCRSCLAQLAPGGSLYFSTNSRSLKFDPSLIGGAATKAGMTITDLSEASVPEDFRNKRIHRLWKFSDSGITAV